MEINTCPSMNCDSKLDEIIKTGLNCDMLNLLGYIPFSNEYFEAYKIEKRYKPPHRREIGRVHNILDLSVDNALDKLSVEDWNILFEFDEENHRKGDLERIFPNRNNVLNY